MTDLFPAAERADHHAARLLLPHLASGDAITWRTLNAARIAPMAGRMPTVAGRSGESFEVLEHAIALYLREAGPALASFADVTGLIELKERLPTQTVRSEEQLDWQRFSTPIDIAAVAVLLADIQADDIIIEPSAGNGLLVAQVRRHQAFQFDELDPVRRGRLHDVFPVLPSPGMMARRSTRRWRTLFDPPSS